MGKIKNLFRGYLELFKYFYSSKSKYFLNFPLSIGVSLIILGLIGIIRNILEVLVGGSWARAWFAFKPDIFFVMFFYPIYLCFFPIVLIFFLTKIFNLKIDIKKIFLFFFFLQIVHIFIPFLDGLAEIYNIPYHLFLDSSLYLKLIFSPLALTPIILFFTVPTSFGINVVWLFTTIVSIKFFSRELQISFKKVIPILIIGFYIVYMSIYPVYYFYLCQNDYLFGLYFMILSIFSVICYVYYSRPIKNPFNYTSEQNL